jgi:hypothetical protein
MRKFILVCVCCGLTLLTGKAATPAFPTAEGFGSVATGGRGGVVIEVTNLQDDATGATVGSLRWALNQNKTVPATIVFRVGGVIKLVADLRSTRTAGTTIAGQTAPTPGITIRQHKVNLGGSVNLVVRNIRFRIGLIGDTAFAAGGSLGLENGGRFIFDHCDFGWSGEENFTMYDDTMTTVQWSVLHEGLYACGHSKGARSYGCQWGGQKVTFHHNLLAHNYNRSPRFNGARSNDRNAMYDFVNNVNYNWGKENSCYGGDFDASGLSNRCNMVNNYYKPGLARPGTSASYFVQASYSANGGTSKIPQYYMSGNYMEGTANTTRNTDNYNGLDASGYSFVAKSTLISSTSFPVDYPVTTESAADAYNSVLNKAGVMPRDTTIRRIINEVRTGTASGMGTSPQYLNNDLVTYTNNPFFNVVRGIIDNPSLAFGAEIAYPSGMTTTTVIDNDHDGMDDAWELANGFDPTNANDRNTLVPSGYTVLEVYLNSLMGETIPLTVGLKKNESVSQIGFFPNPVVSTLNLISPEVINGYFIHDISGKCMQKKIQRDVTNIDVSSLKNGMYLLTLETEFGGKVNLKFTK